MKQKAFTLIELLVVIAVIGVIASIVLVNLRGARERAKIAKNLQFSQSIYHSLGAYAVGVWSFDDPITDGFTTDISGYGNNCTVNGTPTSTEGIIRNALEFDGSTEYVNCGAKARLEMGTDDMTVTAWIKINNTLLNHMGIVTKGAHGSLDVGYELSYRVLTQNDIHFWIGHGGDRIYTSSDDNLGLDDGNWHFIAVSVDRDGDIVYYVDSDNVGSASIASYASNDITNPARELRIGRWSAANQSFDGFIDEVRIYKESFTAGEVQKHYAEELERHKIAEK